MAEDSKLSDWDLLGLNTSSDNFGLSESNIGQSNSNVGLSDSNVGQSDSNASNSKSRLNISGQLKSVSLVQLNSSGQSSLGQLNSSGQSSLGQLDGAGQQNGRSLGQLNEGGSVGQLLDLSLERIEENGDSYTKVKSSTLR